MNSSDNRENVIVAPAIGESGKLVNKLKVQFVGGHAMDTMGNIMLPSSYKGVNTMKFMSGRDKRKVLYTYNPLYDVRPAERDVRVLDSLNHKNPTQHKVKHKKMSNRKLMHKDKPKEMPTKSGRIKVHETVNVLDGRLNIVKTKTQSLEKKANYARLKTIPPVTKRFVVKTLKPDLQKGKIRNFKKISYSFRPTRSQKRKILYDSLRTPGVVEWKNELYNKDVEGGWINPIRESKITLDDVFYKLRVRRDPSYKYKKIYNECMKVLIDDYYSHMVNIYRFALLDFTKIRSKTWLYPRNPFYKKDLFLDTFLLNYDRHPIIVRKYFAANVLTCLPMFVDSVKHDTGNLCIYYVVRFPACLKLRKMLANRMFDNLNTLNGCISKNNHRSIDDFILHTMESQILWFSGKEHYLSQNNRTFLNFRMRVLVNNIGIHFTQKSYFRDVVLNNFIHKVVNFSVIRKIVEATSDATWLINNAGIDLSFSRMILMANNAIYLDKLVKKFTIVTNIIKLDVKTFKFNTECEYYDETCRIKIYKRMKSLANTISKVAHNAGNDDLSTVYANIAFHMIEYPQVGLTANFSIPDNITGRIIDSFDGASTMLSQVLGTVQNMEIHCTVKHEIEIPVISHVIKALNVSDPNVKRVVMIMVLLSLSTMASVSNNSFLELLILSIQGVIVYMYKDDPIVMVVGSVCALLPPVMKVIQKVRSTKEVTQNLDINGSVSKLKSVVLAYVYSVVFATGQTKTKDTPTAVLTFLKETNDMPKMDKALDFHLNYFTNIITAFLEWIGEHFNVEYFRNFDNRYPKYRSINDRFIQLSNVILDDRANYNESNFVLIKSLRLEVTALLNGIPIDVATRDYRSAVAVLKTNIEKMVNNFEMKNVTNTGDRIEPLLTMWIGPSQIGKSTLAAAMNNELRANVMTDTEWAAHLANPKATVYNEDPDKDHMDDYYNNWSIYIDDFGAIKEDGKNPTAIKGYLSLIRYVNTAEFKAKKAAIEDKGSCPIVAREVTGTSNLKILDPKSFECVDAIVNRVHFPFLIVPKDQYCIKGTVTGDPWTKKLAQVPLKDGKPDLDIYDVWKYDWAKGVTVGPRMSLAEANKLRIAKFKSIEKKTGAILNFKINQLAELDALRQKKRKEGLMVNHPDEEVPHPSFGVSVDVSWWAYGLLVAYIAYSSVVGWFSSSFNYIRNFRYRSISHLMAGYAMRYDLAYQLWVKLKMPEITPREFYAKYLSTYIRPCVNEVKTTSDAIYNFATERPILTTLLLVAASYTILCPNIAHVFGLQSGDSHSTSTKSSGLKYEKETRIKNLGQPIRVIDDGYKASSEQLKALCTTKALIDSLKSVWGGNMFILLDKFSITSEGENRHFGIMIVPSGLVAITDTHVMNYVKKNTIDDTNYTFTALRYVGNRTIQQDIRGSSVVDNIISMKSDVGYDICYVNFAETDLGCVRDITHLLMPREESYKIDSFYGTLSVWRAGKTPAWMPMPGLFIADGYATYGENDEYSALRSYVASVRTFKGDSGAIVFSHDTKTGREPKIMSIHVSGTESDDHIVARSLPLFKEPYMAAVSFFEGIRLLPLEKTECSYIVRPEPSVVVDDISLDVLPEQFVPLYMLPGKSPPFKTKIVKAPLYGAIGPSEYYPAVVRDRIINGVDLRPRYMAMNKYGRPRVPLDLKLAYASADSYISRINHFSSRNDGPLEWTFEEAFYGDTFLSSIDVSTSPGYPDNLEYTDKRHLFKVDKNGKCDFSNPLCQELKKDCLDWIDKLSRGEVPMAVFTDFWKDELIKKSKIIKGKLRMVSGAPTRLVMVIRMLFGPAISWFIENLIRNGSAIGINPDGDHWSYLVDMLSRPGDNIIAGDHGNWDGGVRMVLFFLAHYVIENTYFRRVNKGKVRARYVSNFMFANSVHLMINEEFCLIYQMYLSLSSGHPLTALYNTIINNIITRYMIVSVLIDIPYEPGIFDWNNFECHIYIVCFGDDILLSISNMLVKMGLNQLSLTSMFDRYGMEFTDELKLGVSYATRSLSDVSFLKRTFVWSDRYMRWIGPLPLDSIINPVYWCKKKTKDYDYVREVQIALFRIAMLGEQVFEQKAKLLIDVAKEKEIDISITSYDECLAKALRLVTKHI